ncbi:MAG: CPBP family intramembrane metalloprotease [Chloroflexi bacterium]|nr:CPBP family intramembrane metalloprotease [Chloroflexota bacterium]
MTLAIALVFAVGRFLERDSAATPVATVLAASAFVSVVMVAAAYGMGPRAAGGLRALFGGRRSSPARMLGWAALAFLASYAATLVYVLAAESVTDAAVPSPIPASFLEELPLLTLVLVVLVGPAAEEIFFRGFCFAGLVGRWGFWGAAVASSGLFGLAHLDPALMGPAFVSGFVFAWVYWRTGSLWPVVLAHTARNGVALAVVASLL